MAEITKKDIEGILSGQLSPLVKALNQNSALLTHVAEDTSELKDKVAHIEEVVDDHTRTLDSIFKNTQDWKSEAASLRSAIKRHEEWIAQIAAKVGLDLKTEK